MERAQEPGNGLLFYRARKLPGKFTGASRNTLSGPVKFPGKLPDKLTGPEITGTFEKRAPAFKSFLRLPPSFNFFVEKSLLENDFVKELKACNTFKTFRS